MPKMVKCKTCGEEIAKSAKVCPRCGAKKKNIGFAVACVLIIFIAFLVILVVIANSGKTSEGRSSAASSTATQNQTATPKSTDMPSPSFEPVSGTVGNWEITVNGFEYKNSVSIGLITQYASSENAKFCLVNVTVKNVGKEANTFLPYFAYGNMATAKIEWNGYEYTRSELFFSNDNLSSEQLNPLVTATGDIAFDVPEDLINSEIPPTFIISSGNESFSCELVKK